MSAPSCGTPALPADQSARMHLLIGPRGTRRVAARQAGGPAATLIEPPALSVPGWCCDPENPSASRLVADGQAIDAARLTDVSTTLDAVLPSDLPHVRAADREFVAAEMTAFLRVWLATLACPVTGPAADGASHLAAPPSPDGGGNNRDPLVLLWGTPQEEPLAAVHRALLAARARTFLLDQRRTLSARLNRDETLLSLAGNSICLADVTAAYPRPYPSLPVIRHGYPARGVALRHTARLEYRLWHWLATAQATVLNRPQAAASNNAKPLQTRAASACGFRVPDSLLTNDPAAAVEFAARHGQVIYKGASGTRTRPGLFDPADTSRLARLGTCPTYFQRYVRGTNVRVHVVGTQLFATQISSDAVDYRNQWTDMRPLILPEATAARCVAVTRELGLLFAGIDLIRTPDDDWYFLEANPSPAFTFFPGGDQVAAAVARLLIRPAR